MKGNKTLIKSGLLSNCSLPLIPDCPNLLLSFLGSLSSHPTPFGLFYLKLLTFPIFVKEHKTYQTFAKLLHRFGKLINITSFNCNFLEVKTLNNMQKSCCIAWHNITTLLIFQKISCAFIVLFFFQFFISFTQDLIEYKNCYSVMVNR